MRTFIKSCFSVMAASLLVLSMHANAAESSKDKVKKDDPLTKCQLECKSKKDNESYEGCMLKCKETYKNKGPVAPTQNK